MVHRMFFNSLYFQKIKLRIFFVGTENTDDIGGGGGGNNC